MAENYVLRNGVYRDEPSLIEPCPSCLGHVNAKVGACVLCKAPMVQNGDTYQDLHVIACPIGPLRAAALASEYARAALSWKQ